MRPHPELKPQRRPWACLPRVLQNRTPESPHLDANQLADLVAGSAPDAVWSHLSRCETCRLASVLAAESGLPEPRRSSGRVFSLHSPVPRWAPAAAALLLIGSAVWWRMRLPLTVHSPAANSAPPLRVRRIARVLPRLAPARRQAGLTPGARLAAAPPPARPARPLVLPAPTQLAITTEPAASAGNNATAAISRPSLAGRRIAAETGIAVALPFPKRTYAALNFPAAPVGNKTVEMTAAPPAMASQPVATLASRQNGGHGILTALFTLRRMGSPLLQDAWNTALAGHAHASALNFALASEGMQPQNTLVANPPAGMLDSLPAGGSETTPAAFTTAHWRLWHGELQRSLVGRRYWEPISAGEVRFRSLTGNGSTLWAGSDDGRLFFTRDGGEHWQVVQLRNAAGQPLLAPITYLRMHGRQGELRAGASFWRTRDGGLHWQPQP